MFKIINGFSNHFWKSHIHSLSFVVGQYTYMSARPAVLQDIIKYIDINQSVPVEQMVDQAYVDNSPAPFVFDDIRDKQLIGGHKVHFINGINIVVFERFVF